MSDRVLITGGAGFIGSFLADYYLAQGAAVRILDNLDPQVHPQGRPEYLAADVDLHIADVRDKDALRRALEGVDVVIHAAAAVGVGQSMYRVQHYIDTNAGGTAALLDVLIERKQNLRKLIVFTSMTGYGEGFYRRPSDGTLLRVDVRTQEQIDRWGWEPVDPATGEVLVAAPTPERAAPMAKNVYALSKRYQEELALSLGEFYGIPTTCLRLFNVYGPRQSLSNPYTGVLAIFLSRIMAGHAPMVYEDGQQTRDFVSVHDVVRAAALAVENPASDGMVLNVGTGKGRTIAEIASTLARLLGRAEIAPTVSGQFRKGDIRHCLADISQLQTTLGFTPQTDWEASLTEIINWSATAPQQDSFQQADQELRAHGIIK
ncbi:NAD-dependent epimerase/dehydratase family protein [Candidatus Oscillochloris fontis]|uniref:NAD-dependent epimerase/dehydratase family protein n=1 Tax=Candidatus Oscillochloris fontis TaxID=2496868 RepID=UPI00101DB44E|nr:NAD-dependent epimerase/dehydratase family protein [Candidatus Oscillochloris fontis]